MVELTAFLINVLQGAQSAVLVIQGHHQAPVTCDTHAVSLNAFALKVGVIGVGCAATEPNLLNCLTGNLVLALLCGFAQDLGLVNPPCVGHLLKLGELAANVCTPSLLHP